MIEQILRGLAGTTALIGVCCLLSRNRHAIPWRLVAGGLLLQGILAFLILATPFSGVVEAISAGFVKLLGFSDIGARFMFGELVDASRYGFAFKVLPVILFVSALTSGCSSGSFSVLPG